MASQRILVADDERHICRLLQANLLRRGYDVCVADDGREALKLLQTKDFDRAMLDYGMPEPNGYQVLEFIRTTDAIKDLWVGLFVHESQVELVKSFPHKADWYSCEPFNPVDWMG